MIANINNKQCISRFKSKIALIVNLIIFIYCTFDVYDLFFGKFFYDGWRYAIYMIPMDILFVVVLLHKIKHWKAFFFFLLNMITLNLGLGLRVNIIPMYGSIISFIFFVIILYLYFKYPYRNNDL